jgi:hypothetical protein
MQPRRAVSSVQKLAPMKMFVPCGVFEAPNSL